MTVGQRIRNLRKERGLTADRLADIIGVSRSTMFRYENGDIEKVPGDILGPISVALNTTPAHLMGWESDPQEQIDSSAPDFSDLDVLADALSRLSNEQLLDVINKATARRAKD